VAAGYKAGEVGDVLFSPSTLSVGRSLHLYSVFDLQIPNDFYFRLSRIGTVVAGEHDLQELSGVGSGKKVQRIRSPQLLITFLRTDLEGLLTVNTPQRRRQDNRIANAPLAPPTQ
jgi:hypothetical protein